jgi:hypothetical protein
MNPQGPEEGSLPEYEINIVVRQRTPFHPYAPKEVYLNLEVIDDKEMDFIQEALNKYLNLLDSEPDMSPQDLTSYFIDYIAINKSTEFCADVLLWNKVTHVPNVCFDMDAQVVTWEDSATNQVYGSWTFEDYARLDLPNFQLHKDHFPF